MPLPFHEVAGQPLNTEQVAYLEGLFAGLRNRGLSFGDVVPAPVAAPVAPDLSELTNEERIKRELHPLDAYSLLLQHAAANQAPDKENTFRFHDYIPVSWSSLCTFVAGEYAALLLRR